MARASATSMADGNTTEMAAAMVDGDCNGNGQWQRGQQWAIATAMAMAMALELVTATEMAMAMAIATAKARGTITKEGLPPHVAEMCSAFGGVTPCLHPHGHKGKCIYQRCIMGVTLLRVFAPPQGGGFLTTHHGLFFVNFLQLLFSLLNNPLFAHPHYSGAQELCQPIDALPPPLFQEPRQPIDNLPRLLLHFLSR
jgi:hypothetical protein